MNIEALQQYVVYISAGILGFIVLNFIFYAFKKPSKSTYHDVMEEIKIDEAPARTPAVTIEESREEPAPVSEPSPGVENLLKPSPRFTTVSKVAPEDRDVKPDPQAYTPPPPKKSHWS